MEMLYESMTISHDLIEIVTILVYYTIPFGFSLFRHYFGITYQSVTRTTHFLPRITEELKSIKIYDLVHTLRAFDIVT